MLLLLLSVVLRTPLHFCRRCGTAIRMVHHGEHNRSTYWCPACQAEPVPGD